MGETCTHGSSDPSSPLPQPIQLPPQLPTRPRPAHPVVCSPGPALVARLTTAGV